jgi:hypothetical protein
VNDFPLVQVPESFVRERPDLENLFYARTGPKKTPVLLPPGIETTGIDGRKFDIAAPDNPTMLVGTAEEWVIYNDSIPLWGDTHPDRQPCFQFKTHFIAHAITGRQGREHFEADPYFQVVTGHMDHPFHMHVNPFWVLRIEVPDESGELHDVLAQPCWMDTVYVPRGGRVIFRSRFADYAGDFVNHCHILVHEDYGMMRGCSATHEVVRSNYVARPRVTRKNMTAEEVSALYGRPSLGDSYKQSLSFLDSNRETGQIFPGFSVEPPPYIPPENPRKETM